MIALFLALFVVAGGITIDNTNDKPVEYTPQGYTKIVQDKR